jgi:hypothetical protein
MSHTNTFSSLALFVDQSGSMTLATVQSSFNFFNDRLSDSGFRVVRGVFNTAEDWVNPCLSATVTFNQSDTACTSNSKCQSRVCVDGFCADSFQSMGETCDPNDSLDCQNLACGREMLTEGSPFICCPSHSVLRLSAFGSTQNFCAGLPLQASCGLQNALCESGVCVGGLCQEEKQGIGETCDAADQVDCANNACGREMYAEGSPFIC